MNIFCDKFSTSTISTEFLTLKEFHRNNCYDRCPNNQRKDPHVNSMMSYSVSFENNISCTYRRSSKWEEF